jgi:hypothetical protein
MNGWVELIVTGMLPNLPPWVPHWVVGSAIVAGAGLFVLSGIVALFEKTMELVTKVYGPEKAAAVGKFTERLVVVAIVCAWEGWIVWLTIGWWAAYAALIGGTAGGRLLA